MAHETDDDDVLVNSSQVSVDGVDLTFTGDGVSPRGEVDVAEPDGA